MDLWHPDAEQVRAPSASWGTYVDGYPARGVLHTTETSSYTKSTSTYYGRNVWPHATISRGKIWQHIPINRAARALKNAAGGVETNNAHAVQCEIVWRAHDARSMPDDLLASVESWMRWVEQTLGVQRVAPEFFGDDAGFTVASVSARQRMSTSAWKSFNGWCGHQHVPENDHWDPGAIDIARLLEGDNDMPLNAGDLQAIRSLFTVDGHDSIIENFNRLHNLEAVADRDLSVMKPLLDEIKQAIDAPDTDGGSGQITTGTIDAIAKRVLDAQSERLKS